MSSSRSGSMGYRSESTATNPKPGTGGRSLQASGNSDPSANAPKKTRRDWPKKTRMEWAFSDGDDGGVTRSLIPPLPPLPEQEQQQKTTQSSNNTLALNPLAFGFLPSSSSQPAAQVDQTSPQTDNHPRTQEQQQQMATLGGQSSSTTLRLNPAASEFQPSFSGVQVPEYQTPPLPTPDNHVKYLDDDIEKYAELESDLWWIIRSGRAKEAAHIIFRSVGLRSDSSRCGGLSGVASSTGTGSAEVECRMSLRGGLIHDRDGVDKRVWKRRGLEVVGEEDAVAGTTGGRIDTSEAFVLKRRLVLAGGMEGTVGEGFEMVDAAGLVGANGLGEKEAHPHKKDGHQQQRDKGQDNNAAEKGKKRKSTRNWLASWIPWRSAPSAPESKKSSNMGNKMDGQYKRSSSKRPPSPPAQGSRSRAGGGKSTNMARNDQATADKKDHPRFSTDRSSWLMVNDNSDDIVNNSTNTSDTSVETAHDDNNAMTTQTLDPKPTTNDEADTTTVQPEKMDYASMVGEAGNYYGRKDKGVARGDGLIDRYPVYAQNDWPPPYFDMVSRGGRHRNSSMASTQQPRYSGVKDVIITESKEEPRGRREGCWDGNVLEQQARRRRVGVGLSGRHERRRLLPDQPTPEERRHMDRQDDTLVAASNNVVHHLEGNHGAGTTRPVVVRPATTGPPDIFGNTNMRMRGGRVRHGGDQLSSCAEVIVQAKKKPRFSLPALSDIPRGLGRLVGRVIDHGEMKVKEVEEVEEGGVVEHKEDVSVASGGSSGGGCSNQAQNGDESRFLGATVTNRSGRSRS